MLSQAWSANPRQWDGEGKGKEISKPTRGRDPTTKASCPLPGVEAKGVSLGDWQYLRIPLVPGNSEGKRLSQPALRQAIE